MIPNADPVTIDHKKFDELQVLMGYLNVEFDKIQGRYISTSDLKAAREWMDSKDA